MKHTNRKILMVAVVMLLACVMLLAAPVTTYAKSIGDATVTNRLTVSSENVQINLSDAEMGEEIVYEMTFSAMGALFSGYEMSLHMPDFVEVVEVVPSVEVEDITHAAFSCHITSEGYINTIFTCPENVDGITLFCVRFTVKEYVQSYCMVECISSLFTDNEVNAVSADFALGYIQIGESTFARMGDVDGNGIVNLADLLVIQRSIVNPTYALSEAQYAVADINHDGVVNVFDCQYIQNYLVNRIDSLEGIGNGGSAFYSIKITITSQNGEVLFDGARTAMVGEAYESFMTPIFVELSKSYDISGNLSIHTDVYGDVPIDSDGEGYVVKGNDAIKMVVNAEKKERVVKYVYNDTTPNADGTEVYTKYTFYADGTLDVLLELIENDIVIDSEEQQAEWKEKDGYINVIFPNYVFEKLFRIGADGSLIMNKGNNQGGDGGSDHPDGEYCIQSSSIGIGYHGVVVGSAPQALIDQLCEHYYTATFDKVGTETIWITPDLIDCSAVDFNTPGEYEVKIYITRYGNNESMSVTVFVLRDMSRVEVVGEYAFQDPTGGEMDIQTVTVYKDGTLQLDTYYQAQLITYKTNVVIFTLDGVEMVLALDDTAKTASWYQPPAEELIGSYTLSEHGMDISYRVYGKYTVAGDYVTVISTSYGGVQTSMTSIAHYDQKNAWISHFSLPCRMTFDASGVLSVAHLTESQIVDPTCMKEGEEIHRCTICDEVVSKKPIERLAHEYGADGLCAGCGYSETEINELYAYQAEMMEQIENRWAELMAKYGELADYLEQYEKYRAEIEKATGISEINEYMRYFDMMEEKINRVYGNEGPTNEVWVSGAYVENDYPTFVTQGADIEQFITKHLVGNRLAIELSNGKSTYITITRDMITWYSGDFSTVCNVEINMHVEGEGYTYDYSVWVTVNPDLGDAEGVDYTFTDSTLNGWYTITVYEGYVKINDGYYAYDIYSQNGDLTVIRFDAPAFYGRSVVTLNKKTNMAEFYRPTESVLGTYTLYEGDNVYIYTLYGIYGGSGDYVAGVLRKLGDGSGEYKEENYYTTLVYYDRDQCVISDALYGAMTYDDKNLLTVGGMLPKPPMEEDFEKKQDRIKDDIKVLWSEIEQGDYEVTQEQRDQMDDIIDRVYQASDIWGLDELYREAKELHNQITGVCEIEWYSVEGIPRRVVVGTTMEDFLEMLGGATLILHYSNGSEEMVMLTIDMMDFVKIDLNTEGEWDLCWTYQMDDRTLEGIYELQVIPNMVENASLKGMYTFLPHHEGATDEMLDMLYIKLYDNKYAMLYDVDGVHFVEYTQSGNIVEFMHFDTRFVYEIMLDDDGNPMGISAYRVQSERVYTLETEDEYVTVEVFAYGDGYLGFFTLIERNNDGSEEYGEGTCDVFFNDEETKICAGPLEGWYEICADGSLVPTGCAHKYGADGSCLYCGHNPNQSGNGNDFFENVVSGFQG